MGSDQSGDKAWPIMDLAVMLACHSKAR